MTVWVPGQKLSADVTSDLSHYSCSGYERYNAMRADPALCFLEKVGMPDEKSLSAEQGVTDGTSDIPER